MKFYGSKHEIYEILCENRVQTPKFHDFDPDFWIFDPKFWILTLDFADSGKSAVLGRPSVRKMAVLTTFRVDFQDFVVRDPRKPVLGPDFAVFDLSEDDFFKKSWFRTRFFIKNHVFNL